MRNSSNPTLTVWTQNLYVGGDIKPVIYAESMAEVAGRVEELFNDVLASRFPVRARRLAREIRAANPDLIGLQEVVRWESGIREPAVNGKITMDYLDILLDALRDEGLRYRAAAVSTNGHLTLPSVSHGFVKLADRDVILVSDRLRLLAAREGNFRNQAGLSLGGANGRAACFNRGWTAADVRLDGRVVRFLNTHLDEREREQVRRAQARELWTLIHASPYPVIAVGDFNGQPDALDPVLWRPRFSGVMDYWRALRPDDPGFTFSLIGTNGRPHAAHPDRRFDLVLGSTRLAPCEIELCGVAPNGTDTDTGDGSAARNGDLWISDHAGVRCTVSLS